MKMISPRQNSSVGFSDYFQYSTIKSLGTLASCVSTATYPEIADVLQYMIILLNESEKVKGTIPSGQRDDSLLDASESIDVWIEIRCWIKHGDKSNFGW